jgi:hypothetical protein
MLSKSLDNRTFSGGIASSGDIGGVMDREEGTRGGSGEEGDLLLLLVVVGTLLDFGVLLFGEDDLDFLRKTRKTDFFLTADCTGVALWLPFIPVKQTSGSES